MITQEVLEKVLKGAEQVGSTLATGATQLTAEAINFYIFVAFLSVIKFAAVFIVYLIFKKYLDTLAEAGHKYSQLARVVLLSTSILYFIFNSYPHLIEIGKALVAPNVFLIEKATSLVRK